MASFLWAEQINTPSSCSHAHTTRANVKAPFIYYRYTWIVAAHVKKKNGKTIPLTNKMLRGPGFAVVQGFLRFWSDKGFSGGRYGCSSGLRRHRTAKWGGTCPNIRVGRVRRTLHGHLPSDPTFARVPVDAKMAQIVGGDEPPRLFDIPFGKRRTVQYMGL